MRFATLVGIVLFAAALGGCSNSDSIKPEDSMGPVLEQGKKDQNITTDVITPKDKMGKAPDKSTAPPSGGSNNKGVGAPTDK
jgi:PBP1b-binding outer membrane lipoprotein LpoB